MASATNSVGDEEVPNPLLLADNDSGNDNDGVPAAATEDGESPEAETTETSEKSASTASKPKPGDDKPQAKGQLKAAPKEPSTSMPTVPLEKKRKGATASSTKTKKAAPKSATKVLTAIKAKKTATKTKKSASTTKAKKKMAAAADIKPSNTTNNAGVDGRSQNKGASSRESYSVAYKAKMVRDYDTWEAARKKKGEPASVREYVKLRNLGQKYEKFLSACGWRSPKTKQRILDDAARTEFQHMARMPDRNRNHSYYADMEAALLERIAEYRANHWDITTKTIRELAKQELRRITNNDTAKVNAFKASNGWVHNFLKRQERNEREAMLNFKKQQETAKQQLEEDVDEDDAGDEDAIDGQFDDTEDQHHDESKIDQMANKTQGGEGEGGMSQRSLRSGKAGKGKSDDRDEKESESAIEQTEYV